MRHKQSEVQLSVQEVTPNLNMAFNTVIFIIKSSSSIDSFISDNSFNILKLAAMVRWSQCSYHNIMIKLMIGLPDNFHRNEYRNDRHAWPLHPEG